ncbi:hypothetical protein [Mesorhizobium sp. M0809]|uniref:hypothetical protein n=1 Tax=Mesorhizobium sp. M0809 TaxID=2957003 RepID=UPI003337CC71
MATRLAPFVCEPHDPYRRPESSVVPEEILNGFVDAGRVVAKCFTPARYAFDLLCRSLHRLTSIMSINFAACTLIWRNDVQVFAYFTMQSGELPLPTRGGGIEDGDYQGCWTNPPDQDRR